MNLTCYVIGKHAHPSKSQHQKKKKILSTTNFESINLNFKFSTSKSIIELALQNSPPRNLITA